MVVTHLSVIIAIYLEADTNQCHQVCLYSKFGSAASSRFYPTGLVNREDKKIKKKEDFMKWIKKRQLCTRPTGKLIPNFVSRAKCLFQCFVSGMVFVHDLRCTHRNYYRVCYTRRIYIYAVRACSIYNIYVIPFRTHSHIFNTNILVIPHLSACKRPVGLYFEVISRYASNEVKQEVGTEGR